MYFHEVRSQEVHSHLKYILILFLFKAYCSRVILFHKTRKPPTCTLCFLHIRKDKSFGVVLALPGHLPPSSWADLLSFSLHASAFLPLPLPLLFSWPSTSLHIKVIVHGWVEMYAFCEAFSHFGLCKRIFLSLSFYCCISQNPLRKAIHASGLPEII